MRKRKIYALPNRYRRSALLIPVRFTRTGNIEILLFVPYGMAQNLSHRSALWDKPQNSRVGESIRTLWKNGNGKSQILRYIVFLRREGKESFGAPFSKGLIPVRSARTGNIEIFLLPPDGVAANLNFRSARKFKPENSRVGKSIEGWYRFTQTTNVGICFSSRTYSSPLCADWQHRAFPFAAGRHGGKFELSLCAQVQTGKLAARWIYSHFVGK